MSSTGKELAATDDLRRFRTIHGHRARWLTRIGSALKKFRAVLPDDWCFAPGRYEAVPALPISPSNVHLRLPSPTYILGLAEDYDTVTSISQEHSVPVSALSGSEMVKDTKKQGRHKRTIIKDKADYRALLDSLAVLAPGVFSE